MILTEGDSAKTLAVAGLGVVGRDHYGVFPLRGKLLNVRESSAKQVIVCGTIKTSYCLVKSELVFLKYVISKHVLKHSGQTKSAEMNF